MQVISLNFFNSDLYFKISFSHTNSFMTTVFAVNPQWEQVINYYIFFAFITA